MNKHQAVTCGHTQYGGYSVFQRLWLVLAFLYLDKEVASKPRTAHTAGTLYSTILHSIPQKPSLANTLATIVEYNGFGNISFTLVLIIKLPT